MGDKNREMTRARDLANLWNSLDIYSDYSSLSNIMKEHRDDWDGYLCVNPYSDNKTVFSSWLSKARDMFLEISDEGDSLSQKKILLNRIKADVKWWNENKGSPVNQKGLDMSIVLPHSSHTSLIIKDNPDIYEEWCNIWLDNGWANGEELLATFLVSSILENNYSLVNRLLTEFKLNVNLDIKKNPDTHFKFKNKYYDSTKHQMKLGFFVRSQKMADILSKFGFDWSATVCGDTPLLSVIQEKSDEDFSPPIDRTKIITSIIDFNLKNKGWGQLDVVSAVLSGLKIEENVDSLLQGIDWKSIRGKNGENMLHMIAKYAPTKRVLEKYIDIEGRIELMNSPDNNGRFPLEYLLCFSSYSNVHNDIMAKVNRGEIPKPDWLEVKLLIAENCSIRSAVDQVDKSIWKQKTPSDFTECLEKERGQKLFRMATECCLRYNKDFNSSYPLNLGLEIVKYEYPGIAYSAFHRCAKNKNDTELYLAQSWMFLCEHNKSMRNKTLTEMLESIDILTDKAISFGVSVTKMKNEFLKNGDSKIIDNFNNFMCENSEKWENIEAIEERYKLRKAVKNTGQHPNISPPL